MTHDNPLSISEQVFISLFVAALMPLNNALNKSEACLSLLVRRISGVTQRSISNISLMCFEKHTCILRKHSVRLEPDQPDFSPTLLQTSKKLCQASAISHSQKIWALYREYQISRKTSRCICVVRVSLQSCVIIAAWLNAKGQVLDFGKRTKSTVGNLTFKSKKCFFFFPFLILRSMKIEPAVKLIIVTVNCYN